MPRQLSLALLATLVLVAVGSAAETASLHGIPYKPDPPPAIDGRLDEWEGVPNALIARTRQHCTHAPAKWASAEDLSARIWLAWRDEYLYLAADVTDDQHRQPLRDRAMYRGDHLELYLDLLPDVEPQRLLWGRGQVLLGLSPGSLEKTGDKLTDLPPEAVVFLPEGQAAQGVLIAAQKTEQGYVLEAAVPWSLLGKLIGKAKLKPSQAMPLGLEVTVSDTDGSTPAQEKMLSLRTEPWKRARDRLVAAVLAPSDGKPPAVTLSREVRKAAELPPVGKEEWTFAGLTAPPDKEVVLALKARLHSPKPAGYTRGMKLTLNGQALDASRLVNWAAEEPRVTGAMMKPAAGETFNVPYAPDFDSPNQSPVYALRTGPKLCRYELRVTDLVKASENKLLVVNASAREMEKTLVLGEVRLEIREPAVARAKRPAPTGPLPTFQPAGRHKVDYQLTQGQEGRLQIRLGDTTFQVESEFSTPRPGWVQASNDYFDFQRQVESHDEWILVRDTWTNRTQDKLPLMHRHRVKPSAALKKVWLGGLSPSALSSSKSEPANPTAYGATDTLGIGVIALDDVFQVHVTSLSGEDHVGLADNQLVLRPGASYTAQWAILPTATPDYFAFLNAFRRLRGVNFTLPGSFAFLRVSPRTPQHQWSDAQLADFIRLKNAHFVSSGLSWPLYKGHYAHGTGFQTLDLSLVSQHIAHRRTLAPQSKFLHYFHCFIDVRDESPELYADARLLRSDGVQTDYGKPFYRIYVPTHENQFGRDVAKNVDLIMGPAPQGLGCDGVYWDEFEYSRYQYAYGDFDGQATGLPWDGCSADINPKTLQIARLKSAVELISQPFRLALAQKILAAGPLVANGQPHTQTMVRLHFPRFVETGSISHCAKAQAYSPIALGDHLTERSEVDAYRVMLRALDFGCLYYWYNDLTVVPTHPHLTAHMFPFTPLELHEGYVIGQERIVTNRSGLFGWGDAARHEVHVFDDQGREVPDFSAPAVVRDGQTFSELRLPEGFSAAVVRRP